MWPVLIVIRRPLDLCLEMAGIYPRMHKNWSLSLAFLVKIPSEILTSVMDPFRFHRFIPSTSWSSSLEASSLWPMTKISYYISLISRSWPLNHKTIENSGHHVLHQSPWASHFQICSQFFCIFSQQHNFFLAPAHASGTKSHLIICLPALECNSLHSNANLLEACQLLDLICLPDVIE